MKYKAGFCGTHGTGKTTSAYYLVTQLKKKGYDVNILTNVARSCPLPINENATIDSQLWIFDEKIRQEMQSKSFITVCDRTLLDIFEYMKRVDPSTDMCLRSFIKYYMKTYDVIFYMNIKKEFLVDDGIRSVNIEFQKQIKDMIDTDIQLLEIPVFYCRNDDEIVDIVLSKVV